jgi:PAC2 family
VAELYRVFGSQGEDLSGLPMVAMISGFTDSGLSTAQISDHFFANLDSDLLVRFNNDELLDYRSRRPSMYFEKDHIESYEPATLGIHLMRDEAGQKFLFLEGYEPDFRWEAFSEAIVDLVERFEVSSFTWVHSIPFPIPHTRPTGITVSGNRRDMTEKYSEWKPQTSVPGNVMHLLEFKLVEIEVPTVGFVLLVPHYLADNEVPQAALKGIELITAATSLVFPTDEIREREAKFSAKVESQVQENQELAKLVQTLEAGYASTDVGPSRSPIAKPRTEVPNAEQIAQELENYLASRSKTQGEENAE